ncbi:MAG: FADH(2)-oxidizing methylenetetrahydrofolate--tRNA-(uracil(54)-C(5))-methyltransferase TrmFO, partial [Parvibaculum sp.]
GALLANTPGDATAATSPPIKDNSGLVPAPYGPRYETGKRPRGKAKAPARKRAYTSRALQDLDGWLNPAARAAE